MYIVTLQPGLILDSQNDGMMISSFAPTKSLLSKSCQDDDGLDVILKLPEIELEPVEMPENPMLKVENETQKLSIATLSMASSYI